MARRSGPNGPLIKSEDRVSPQAGWESMVGMRKIEIKITTCLGGRPRPIGHTVLNGSSEHSEYIHLHIAFLSFFPCVFSCLLYFFVFICVYLLYFLCYHKLVNKDLYIYY